MRVSRLKNQRRSHMPLCYCPSTLSPLPGQLCSGAGATAGPDTGVPAKDLGTKQAQFVLSYCSEAAVCNPSCAVCDGLSVLSRETLRIIGNK